MPFEVKVKCDGDGCEVTAGLRFSIADDLPAGWERESVRRTRYVDAGGGGIQKNEPPALERCYCPACVLKRR